jgi:hypothetical protein
MSKKVYSLTSVSSNLIGPYSLADLIKHKMDKNTKQSGIYVWGVLHNNKYYPLYVGKGRNICERLFQLTAPTRKAGFRASQTHLCKPKVQFSE